jgi:hypothetical protein
MNLKKHVNYGKWDYLEITSKYYKELIKKQKEDSTKFGYTIHSNPILDSKFISTVYSYLSDNNNSILLNSSSLYNIENTKFNKSGALYDVLKSDLSNKLGIDWIGISNLEYNSRIHRLLEEKNKLYFYEVSNFTDIDVRDLYTSQKNTSLDNYISKLNNSDWLNCKTKNFKFHFNTFCIKNLQVNTINRIILIKDQEDKIRVFLSSANAFKISIDECLNYIEKTDINHIEYILTQKKIEQTNNEEIDSTKNSKRTLLYILSSIQSYLNNKKSISYEIDYEFLINFNNLISKTSIIRERFTFAQTKLVQAFK